MHHYVTGAMILYTGFCILVTGYAFALLMREVARHCIQEHVIRTPANQHIMSERKDT